MEDLRSFFTSWFKILIVTLLFNLSITNAEARTITLLNNCSFPVWFGFLGGPSAPVPDNNNYQLPASGGRSTVTVPGGRFNGVVAGRTNCTAAGCETADCGGGTGACPRGFNQPATQVELNLFPDGDDTYDVEVINGFNLPISLAPDVSSQANNPYRCGVPGAPNPSPGLGACTWNFAPPIVEYQWVKNGGPACSANSDCASGTMCGLSFDPIKNGFTKTCGKLLGYWTANQICGVQRNYGAPFNCSQTLPPPQNNWNWWNLMACAGPGMNTCYNDRAGTDCCGCVNWDKIGVGVPAAPITQQCSNANQNWINGVLPTLKWIKQACPTVYTFPYDDPSSTFTCGKGNNTPNTVNYTITFCPNGNTPPPPPPPPPGKCLAPVNITSTYTADKKSATISWQQPTGSDPIVNYQINNWQNRMIWQGTSLNYTDNTLPGSNGTFTYFLYSNCTSGLSNGVQYDVVINNNPPPHQTCLPPANIKSSVSADKKQITLTWQQPANSAPISTYQVNDWLKRKIWQGLALQYVDKTLPGRPGKFTYFLQTNCSNGPSTNVQFDVVIN